MKKFEIRLALLITFLISNKIFTLKIRKKKVENTEPNYLRHELKKEVEKNEVRVGMKYYIINVFYFLVYYFLIRLKITIVI